MHTNPPRIIRPHHPGKTNNEPHSKQQRDNDEFAEREVETENDGNGDEDDEEIGEDVEHALEEEVEGVVNALLGGE